jgi:signal peptidase I
MRLHFTSKRLLNMNSAPPNPTAENRPRSRLRPGLRVALRALERLLAIIGLCALIRYACLDHAVIVSGSMAPALRGDDAATGDRVIFEKLTRHFRAPRRWEIHRFFTPEGVLVAKRIVGLPGEKVSLRDGVLHIDGAPLPLPPELAHLRYFAYGNLAQDRVVDCGAGYYVLGDYSRDSVDSRFNGPVAREDFLGRAWYVLSPAAHRGFVL